MAAAVVGGQWTTSHRRIITLTVLIGLLAALLILVWMSAQSHYANHRDVKVAMVTTRESSGEAVNKWIKTYPNYIVVAVIVAVLVTFALVAVCCCCYCCGCCKWLRCSGCCCCYRYNRKSSKAEDVEMKKVEAKVSKGKHRKNKQEKEESEFESSLETKEQLASEPTEETEDQDEYSRGVRYFLRKHPQYKAPNGLKPYDLGSRMQKYWYKIESVEDVHNGRERLLTIAPVSQNCPLVIHKRQKALNKLIETVKVHPYLHSIEMVDYLVDHQLLVMVQPLIQSGSLKDMIYKTTPLADWSQKYARRSKGLANDKIAKYGRNVLEALKFLYSKGFPQLGHVQTGNMFVVDGVCHLGGYENTLLGYRTRLFRLCKDHLEHFDVILFGHAVFEMAAGYELTQLRPGPSDYNAVNKKVRAALEFIFKEGFPHTVDEISLHEFFGASLPELSDFSPNEIQIGESASEVLEEVCKAKPRDQKSPRPLKSSTSSYSEGKGVKRFLSSLKMSSKSKSSSKAGKEKERKPLLKDGEKSS